MKLMLRPRRRWKVIGGSVIALVLLVGAVDCYRYDEHAYEDVYVRGAGGEIEVSLTGSHGREQTRPGGPYDLMVRYLAPDSTFERAELVSVTVRGADGGKPMDVRADSAQHLRRITSGGYFWKTASAPVANGNFAVALRMEGIPLEYGDQVVAGTLRLTGAAGVHEVPFTATLRTRPHSEMRSRFWDAFGSV